MPGHEAECNTAYLSTATNIQLAVRHGPTEFCPFDGPSSAQLCLQWEALHDQADTLWRPEFWRTATTVWAPSRRHSVTFASIPPWPELMPCLPTFMVAQRKVSVPVPTSSWSPLQCGRGAPFRQADTDHGMRCPPWQHSTHLRHKILKGISSPPVHWGVIALSHLSVVSPPLLLGPQPTATLKLSATSSQPCFSTFASPTCPSYTPIP
jgi:hypothetical protein